MGFVKKLCVIAALCLLFRFSYCLGADTALDSFVFNAVENGSLVSTAVVGQSPLLMANAAGATADVQIQASSERAADAVAAGESEADGVVELAGSEDAEEVSESPAQVLEKTITTGEGDGYISADGIYIKNATSYSADVASLLNEPMALSMSALSDPQVLIIHTHGSEAYTPDGDDQYDAQSGNYRTSDATQSVMRVGDELAAVLEARGIGVIHDKELYDYPSYVGSYGRSLTAAENYLAQYPDIKIIIDLHRDALVDESGNIYKTVAQIGDETAAQVMLVVGTDTNLEHPNWQQNLQLALRLQSAMNEKYPSLARPINLREERFNQQLTGGALLVEVGTHGNTLQEALKAADYFGDCLADVLESLQG